MEDEQTSRDDTVAGIVRACERAIASLSPTAQRVGEVLGEYVGPPTEDEVALTRARLALWHARMSHRALLRRRRRELRRVERTYRHACADAERECTAAESEVAAAVGEAEGQLRAVMRPRQIATYGPYALFDDSLRCPDWEVSLPSVRALVVPSEAAVLQGGGTKALPLPPVHGRHGRPQLIVQGRRGVSSRDCPQHDEHADDFARLVNVAAMNAGRFDERRRTETEWAATRLEEIRAWAARRVGDARARHSAAVADRAEVETAQRLLVRAQLDVDELDRRRTAVETLEREIDVARRRARLSHRVR